MADAQSGVNAGLVFPANALATGCAFYVLVTVCGPISGVHFNPAVTFAFALLRHVAPGAALACFAVQVASGIAGAWIAQGVPTSTSCSSRRAAARVRAHRWQRWSRPSGCRSRSSETAPFTCTRACLRCCLHHRGPLVHRFDELRQSRSHHRSRADRHLCRYPAEPRPVLPPRPACWRGICRVFPAEALFRLKFRVQTVWNPKTEFGR
ncbi:aquaporin [Albidovulum aquaemixtae]|uniref:aquaporin n=1 Tax=Albidovulum aquaemixtae TaxID=1542388 RepID=UPI0027958ECF|nr:aquaporin [Defluviimonas aquaemixtae]